LLKADVRKRRLRTKQVCRCRVSAGEFRQAKQKARLDHISSQATSFHWLQPRKICDEWQSGSSQLDNRMISYLPEYVWGEETRPTALKSSIKNPANAKPLLQASI
jgi:hypothetical protein